MWEQIRSNQRRSLALVLLMMALLTVLGFVIAEAYMRGSGPFGIAIAMAVWLVMALVAYFQGDSILLAVSGAKEIKHDDHPQLFNIVEEMTIASGLGKMPRVYIIDDMALNAFATGRNPQCSAVAVTAGLLGALNRDQLQGVIAHEMSHVINRDVLLMTMAGVMLGAIAMIAEGFLRGMYYSGAGMRSRRYRSDDRGGNQAQALMMILAVVLAILAPVLAQLIYFAISRRREYLADANAAVLTRYPEGLASALEAIAGDTNVLAHANKATAPMYIINPLHAAGVAAENLTSTHPPIDQRIRILRSMAGGVSLQQYDAAWRSAAGSKRGVIPASALVGSADTPVRAPHDEPAQNPRRRMRNAGDLLRQLNQFLFVTCACGLRVKIPPNFTQEKFPCPRCHRALDLSMAQSAAPGQVSETPPAPPPVTPPGRTVLAAAPLRVARPREAQSSIRCTCGTSVALPSSGRVACPSCGRVIEVGDGKA